MDCGLVGEDPAVRQEAGPGAGSAVGMEAVDDRHRRPKHHILGLCGSETLLPAAAAQAREDNAEQGAVDEVGKNTCRVPGWPVAGQHRAEKSDVGIARRRSDQPRGGRFGPCPHRSSRDACQRSSDQRLGSSAGRARVGRYVNSMDAIHTWSLHSHRELHPAGRIAEVLD
jgi:hypothetical protein